MSSLLRLADRVLPPTRQAWLLDLGLLALRLSFGLSLALGHGWDKFTTFSERADQFPSLLGLGGGVGLALITFAELFCALAVAGGLLTRLAAIPPVIGMAVAFFLVHGADPWQKRELAFAYLCAFAAIGLCGAGRLSLDHAIRKGLERRKAAC